MEKTKKKLVISARDTESLKQKLGNGDLSQVHGGNIIMLPTPVDEVIIRRPDLPIIDIGPIIRFP
jgi:hypothetical protein